DAVDLGLVRRTFRDEEKLAIDYRDEQARVTQRIIRPIALIYYSEAAVVVGWCELRQAIRNFRIDRTLTCAPTGTGFRGEGEALRRLWIAGWRSDGPAAALPDADGEGTSPSRPAR
ncbi:MAG: WYL domain-containing protein, partial [Rhizobium sp.]|nr:WYL domain-containing protein [Rhizobium sp.]